jgi:hypothetical protein
MRYEVAMIFPLFLSIVVVVVVVVVEEEDLNSCVVLIGSN